MKFHTKRGKTIKYGKPHIHIDERGTLFFNREYIKKAGTKTYSVHETEDGSIVIDHDGSDFNIIAFPDSTWKTYNKPLADWLKEKAGTNIFPEPDLVGSFTIKALVQTELKTLKINDTVYSITGLKNYINTLKKRANDSGKEKTRLANMDRFKSVLSQAKRKFPEEFSGY